MSHARNLSTKPISIPSNVHWLEFPRSDGDVRTWPKNTTKVVDHEGAVNFMRPVPLNDPASISWRSKLGGPIAKKLGMPEGPTYMLKDWPKDYGFFDHNKGKEASPRHDLYLHGGTARFRSAPEFLPHAIWLMLDPPFSAPCECKYCTKKPQREITMALTQSGILPSGSHSPGPSRTQRHREPKRDPLTKAREHRARNAKVYSAVQKVVKPMKQAVGPKEPMLRERSNDLRAVLSKTGMKLQRWFREGELLWCALDPPIPGKRGDIDSIKFWPGLVEDVSIKSEAIPTPPDRVVNANSSNGRVDGDDPAATKEDDGIPRPWTVRQQSVYKMKLLAISHNYTVTDEHVLPYQAYAPPGDLIQSLQEFPKEQLDLDPERIATFNPCPSTPEPESSTSPSLFDRAVSAYATALQIGAKISGYWCLTDDWDFKYLVPPHSAARPPPPSGAASLQAAIDAASANNAMVQAHNNESISTGPPSHYHHNISPPNKGMSAEELQALGNRLLGPPLPPAQTVTQTRYQGLWWGAERIWTDELIRLKVSRGCLAPNGAENIYPPSGPSRSVRDAWMASGRDPDEMGAKARGVFMKLDALFVVDVPQQDGSFKKECRASGMLYELADEDWEDPNEVKPQEPITTNGTSSTTNGHAEAGPSFMPVASPLKQPALPNFDPSVPIDATTSTTTSTMLSQPPTNQNDTLSPNSQLSHPPSSTRCVLPPAPIGYKFRPIMPPGHESVMSLNVISGRYYPGLLSHPLLEPVLQRAISTPLEEGGLMENNNLWALEGLSAGFYNSVDPTHAKASRMMMARDADAEGREDLALHVQAMLHRPTPESTPMDVTVS